MPSPPPPLPTDDSTEAIRRLVALLEYTKELSELSRRDAPPITALPSPDNSLLLHQAQLERLREAKRTISSRDPLSGKSLRTQRPVVSLLPDEERGHTPEAVRLPPASGPWVSIHRPDAEDKSAAAMAACAAYAALFSAHQEALREGRGAQLTVGVGIVRWKVDEATVIDHPLVLMPAELRLELSGAYSIRMADAAQPTLWTFPGVARAAAALKLLDECARAYHLLGPSPPPPTAKRAWEPLLQRAAQTLSPDGIYVDGPPRVTGKGALHGAPDEVARVYNGFVVWTRAEAAERGVCDDADALADSLRALPPGALPSALARLVGIYSLPPAPPLGGTAPARWPVLAALRRALVEPLVGPPGELGGPAGSRRGTAGEPPFLYFGLPSNSQQEAVVATLEERGCAVLVGPPGTGKSQTIANIICHYLACGRRVLVTSKGEPALEVLRQKLPPGVRELAVSLGAADASAFRRLEAAVENLADNVAAAQPAALAATTEKLRKQVASLTAELEAMRRDEEAWAAPHFPAADVGGSAGGAAGAGSTTVGPLSRLELHPEVMAELALTNPEAATTAQLADAVAGALALDPRHAPLEAPSCRAFFLRGVALDAKRPPPPQELINTIREVRASCGEALVWGDQALARGCAAVESLSQERLRELAVMLHRRAQIQMAERHGEVPRIASLREARALRARLEDLRAALGELEARIAAVVASGTAAAPAGAPQPIAPGDPPSLGGAGAGTPFGPPDDGSWLLIMLRHADNADACQALEAVRQLAERTADLAAQVEASEPVFVPAMLLRMLDTRGSGGLRAADLSSLAYGGSLLNDSEVAKEVRWRAHPQRRSMPQRLRRSLQGGPSQTLVAGLEHVTVDGRAPPTEREWRLVETRLELQAHAAALREKWTVLDDYVTGLPRLPSRPPSGRAGAGEPSSPQSLQTEPVLLGALMRERHVPRLAACSAACAAAAGVSEQWSRALMEATGVPDAADNGAAALSPPAAAISIQQRQKVNRSSADCADELRRLDVALELHGEELQAAKRERRAILDQIDRAIAASGGGGNGSGGSGIAAFAAALSAAATTPGGPSATSAPPAAAGARAPPSQAPLAELRAAVANLGAVDRSANVSAEAVLAARRRLLAARAALTNVAQLRALARRLEAPAWAERLLQPDPPPAPPPPPVEGSPAAALPASHPSRRPIALDACPPDARRLWAAAAVAAALREAEVRDTRAARAAGGAAQRRLLEREAAVCTLVAAAAKQALRAAMSAETCAGLMRLVSAVSNSGSVGADSARSARYRADLASALTDCAASVPCWIMPTWRVSQCLPATVRSFDLVVIDEASQSNVTAILPLLRGTRVLVVGDQKQVSPTAAFVSEARISDLKAGLLRARHPYVEQLLPERSVFDLAQTSFGDARVSLQQHFRCVPPCITFCNDHFYHGRLLPRRLPPRSRRLEPALVDIFVPNATKRGKTNPEEARALVDYLAAQLARTPSELENSSIGIISLAGVEQARLLRTLLLERLSDAQLAKHRVVVGDATTFQGDERDVILLSMVASRGQAPPQLGRAYEQKYNVALSRARDRMVLFRSLKASDVSNSDDLKLWTIQAFSSAAAGQPSAHALRAAQAQEQQMALRIAATGFDEATADGQLRAWLHTRGYSFSFDCVVAGSTAVVEDDLHDRRLCVCLDGGAAASLAEWSEALKEQRSLMAAGWVFHRIWRASWLVHRARCEVELEQALEAAGVHPNAAAARAGEGAPKPLQPAHHLADALSGGAGSGESQNAATARARRKVPAAAVSGSSDADAEQLEEDEAVVGDGHDELGEPSSAAGEGRDVLHAPHRPASTKSTKSTAPKPARAKPAVAATGNGPRQQTKKRARDEDYDYVPGQD